MRAVEAIANRTGLPEVEQIEISHHHTLTGDALVARLTDVATKLGLDPAAVIGGNVELPKLIEEAVEIEADPLADAPSTRFAVVVFRKNFYLRLYYRVDGDVS